MLDYKNSKLIIDTGSLSGGSVSWHSPSNIAIVKYWGKHGRQLPRNPSISFTLDQAHTHTTVKYRARKGIGNDIQFRFFFDNLPKPEFEGKIRKFLESLVEIFPFLKQLDLDIYSSNSFPHSAGIASSASGMSALALCLCDLERTFFGTLSEEAAFLQKASYIARLGSGSACRSIYPTMALWGQTPALEHSSDLFAVPFVEALHPIFHDFHNDILIISKGAKSVSSRAGHQLMEDHIYAEDRYGQARQRMLRLLDAMKAGDLQDFGHICEQEALTLHALMMSSNTPFMLMEPNTIAAIRKVWEFRRLQHVPVYFTLDAGPNLHLLYPHRYAEQVGAFVTESLLPLCQDGQYIADRVGKGPVKMESAQ